MRDIKFKAKRISEDKWVHGSHVIDASGGHRIANVDKSGEGLNFHKVNPDTVCQFTGLFDERGVLLYEGDRVEIIHTTGLKSTGTMYFDQIEASFLIKNDLDHDGVLQAQSLIKIGNIHD